MSFTLQNKKIWVAGHRGMVGAALLRRLAGEPCTVLTATRQEVDATRQDQVEAFLRRTRPDAIIIAAARVGGILANNTYPAQFLYDNAMIAANIIHAAHEMDVERVLFLGSTCIYPKFAPQPIPEDSLLTGPLEPTNEAYALAKILGVKLCEMYARQYGRAYTSAMPTNLYGIGDNFDLETSHVLPALLRKIDTAAQEGAAEVTLWGTGRPRREFLFVDDLADALVFILQHYTAPTPINVGTGTDVTIAELAETLAEVIGWRGRFVYDTTKPDGTPRKLSDVSRLQALGWQAATPLRKGIVLTYDWYCRHVDRVRHVKVAG